jgi:hypothetical protein
MTGNFCRAGCLGVRAVQETAAAKDDAGSGSGCARFEKMTTCGHANFPVG